jgi:nucleotide-binding universal stress UspA family protein
MLIRHIAVALDGSPHSIAALTAAAELARLLHANLRGIFVEDINLLRMAELPCSHENSAEPEKMELVQLERSLKRQAREAESSLQHIAGELLIEHSFRICRGLVPEEVTLAAHEADLLVLGRKGRSPSCRKGVGSTAKKALAEGKRPILFMRTGFTAKEWPILVLYDGSIGSKQALGTALDLAQPGVILNVLILGESPDEALLMERDLSATITLPDSDVAYYHLHLHDGKTLAQYIRMADSGLLVLCDRMRLPVETLHNLINEIDYPVWLV